MAEARTRRTNDEGRATSGGNVRSAKLFLPYLILLAPVAVSIDACGSLYVGTTKPLATGGAGGAGGTGPGVGGFTTPSTGPGAGGSCGSDPSNPYITHPTCCGGGCLDFPAAPSVVGAGVPSGAAALFGADASSFTMGSLCVLEPQLCAGTVEGAMIPANWVEPRFRGQRHGAEPLRDSHHLSVGGEPSRRLHDAARVVHAQGDLVRHQDLDAGSRAGPASATTRRARRSP